MRKSPSKTFRVYAGWIKNNPDHAEGEWQKWERDVIREYDFIQGPGARLIVMVPTWDGKMYQWFSTATDLELNKWYLDQREGKTPALERFLQTAIKYAPKTLPNPGETSLPAAAPSSDQVMSDSHNSRSEQETE